MFVPEIQIRIPRSPRIELTESVRLGQLGAVVARKLRTRVQRKKRNYKGQFLKHLRRGWPNRALKIPASGTGRFPKPRGGIRAGQFRIFEGGYREYVRLLGKDSVRNYDLSGEMWANMVVKVRLVFGQPVVIIGFKGPHQQRVRNDWLEQTRIWQGTHKRPKGRFFVRVKRTKAEGGGHRYEERQLTERQMRGAKKKASPNSKANYQRLQGGRLDFFMQLSDGELRWCAERTMREIADRLRQQWPLEVLQ